MSLFESNLPPGLVYCKNWLTANEHDAAVAEVDSNVFETTLSRRVQHYGARYEYDSSQVAAIGSAPIVPPVLKVIGERLVAEGFFDRSPEQVIVNEYLSGQGIAAHIDKQSFGPAVATVSLIESWPMLFKNSESNEEFEVVLEVNSLAVMTKESRMDWTHEIRKRSSDYVGGLKIRRGRRISLTYRTINHTS